jgi:hypothetical protein
MVKRSISIHPILFAIYPILFLYSKNIHSVTMTDFFPPLLLILFSVSVLWVLVTRVIKNKEKGALIVSLSLFFFFSFGYFIQIAIPPFYHLFGSFIGPRTVFLLIWGLLFITAIGFIIKAGKSQPSLTTFLNFFSAFMIIFILLTMGLRLSKKGFVSTEPGGETGLLTSTMNMNLKEQENLPDIYYIILDGYARSDVLKELFQFDNRSFLDFLTQKGFFVANKSSSNYGQTLLSLASSLNMKYLNEQDGIHPKSDDHNSLIRMIQHNQVIQFLKRFGYTSVGLLPDQNDLEFLSFDITIKNRFGFSEFQNALLELTPVYLIMNKYLRAINPFQNHRQRILSMFDQLGEISRRIKTPAFIYAHILIPHPPFVFGPNGEEVGNNKGFSQSMWDGSAFYEAGGTYGEYVTNYRNQAVFTTKKIQETLDQLLTNATRPTVIILQGDHGSGSRLDWKDVNKTDVKERFSILNAYYFPNQAGHQVLYDSITPVNSFRILFNLFFKTHLELLPEESFYSTWGRPYKFIPVRRY